jgi:phytanoyl-CoA hydroxylase
MINFIKRFKFSYEFYNFFQKSQLSHNLSQYKKYRIKKKYFTSISSADFDHLSAEPNLHDRLNSRNELPQQAEFNELDKQTQDQLLSWSENGYAILPNFLSHEKVNQINAEVDRLLYTKSVSWKYGNKIMFAIKRSRLLMNIGLDKKISGILNLLMAKEVELFQSINFKTASEQRTHSDSIHMSTFPHGNIIAIWIALEDITEQNGLLHYYPGSHKLPYVMNKDFENEGSSMLLGNKTYSDYEDKIADVVEESGLKKATFTANKGDLLIWHANLLHGGEPLVDKNSTRKSMVFHYYAKDAICYHEITQRPTLKTKFE